MHDTPPKVERADADAEAVARGYEARDIRVGAIALLLVAFVIIFAGLCGGLWFLQRSYAARLTQPAGARSAVQGQATTDAPPLQPQANHPALDNWDLTAMRDGEDKVFGQLGWQRDGKTHRFVVPPMVMAALQSRQAATRSTAATQNGGR